MIRKFATPMVIGGIALSGVTGALMYFHKDVGYNKAAHETFGWALLLGVVLHVSTNWPSFKTYFSSKKPVGLVVMGLFLFVLGSSFYNQPEAAKPPPARLALNAVAKAPLSAVAPLAGTDVATLLSKLSAAGFKVAGPEASIESFAGQGREEQGKAFETIFGGDSKP